ncbi:MAG: thioredoxin family protein [Acutalibacteraceae bacterium]
MAFLVRVKKKAENKKQTACRTEIANGAHSIKVLGAGCKSCRKMYENTKLAVSNIGLGIEVEYITDMREIAIYGVMSMPALVVDEKVASMGKALNVTDVEQLLRGLDF